MKNLEEKQISREEIYDGKVLHMVRDTIELPNGKQSYREMCLHIGASAVIPLLDDGRVIMERQFRYAHGRVFFEIPAGKLDSADEDPLEAAKRELKEETGAIAEKFTYLGRIDTSPALLNEKIHLYLAEGLSFGEQSLDDDEFLNLEYIPLDKLVKMVMSGEICDSKTQIAVLKVHMLKNAMQTDDERRDKYRGCLLGGAVGDALGYSVEFMSENGIFTKYGNRGITEYELRDGVAVISDDTQMTLFTADGLIISGGNDPIESVEKCYLDWLKTQCGLLIVMPEYSRIGGEDALNAARAPGNTCISALSSPVRGSIANPINNSKGCGGVMRVAPVGLYYKNEDIENIDMIAAECAALTHGHELGYIPAAMLAHIVHALATEDSTSILTAVNSAKSAAQKLFAGNKHIDEMMALTDHAIELASSNTPDLEAIKQLGQGWVAEETLAIAIFCALRYENDFEAAIIASVNHSGDSDSTGAVTGNILGAHLGESAIPKRFKDNLELKDLIISIADELLDK